ncbi:hypothetical protein Tco_1081326 [Tanacetum coccineum]|uniref:Uncharacterized protein n=1 Tax=Tanacetum coccineum TaxID=301880 RepID=A0ABQ5HXD8_9ASTR
MENNFNHIAKSISPLDGSSNNVPQVVITVHYPVLHLHGPRLIFNPSLRPGSDVDGKENVDGDGIENVDEGICEVIVKFYE